jgi:hypothetical protein
MLVERVRIGMKMRVKPALYTPSILRRQAMVIWLIFVIKVEIHLQLTRSCCQLTPYKSKSVDKTTPDAIHVNSHSKDGSNQVNALFDMTGPSSR